MDYNKGIIKKIKNDPDFCTEKDLINLINGLDINEEIIENNCNDFIDLNNELVYENNIENFYIKNKYRK